MSSIDYNQVFSRIDNDETVSPAELRVWLQGRRPNLFQGKYNDMTREVIRRHQIKALGDASAVKRDADGRELKADEQREFNRHLATAGEIAAIENELAAAERMNSHAAEALAAENRRPGESKGGVIFPSFAEYKSQSIGSGPGGGLLVPEVNSSQFYGRLYPQSVFMSAVRGR